jgi:hypothetical protein
MTDRPDPWGPYRATLEDHLDTCADYLGRLLRSLGGEIAPDRHYFADKAHQLQTAARRMVRIVQDIDRWLGECGTTVEHDDAEGTRVIGECTLPAGHDGTHDEWPYLEARREEIDSALGPDVSWEPLEDAKASRIALYFGDVDPDNRQDWPTYRAWPSKGWVSFVRCCSPSSARRHKPGLQNPSCVAALSAQASWMRT